MSTFSLAVVGSGERSVGTSRATSWLSTEASAAPASSDAPASSTVALSGAGQLLSAPAVCHDRLELLRTNELLLTDIDFSATTITEAAEQVGAVTLAPANLVTEETPGATLVTPVTPVSTPLATLAPGITEAGALTTANAADSEAFAASLALRDLLADPARHAANNLLDPAYAVLIAASRLRDFVPAEQEGDPKAAAADFPAPVSGLARARAIASYLDAKNGELRQQERAVV